MGDKATTEIQAAARAKELARRERDGQIAVGRGVRIETLDDMFRFCEWVHSSGLAPAGLDSPPKIMIAVEHGLELGFAPMQAIQGIAVINNRPCMWGDLFLAACKQSPEWDEDGFREWSEGDQFKDDYTAYCSMKRRSSSELQTRSFSVADAKRAGLWANQKRDPWIKYPQRMLQMRARAWCGRDTFADALKGVGMAEEVEDFKQVEARVIRDPIRAPQRKSLTAFAEPSDEIPFGTDDTPPAENVATPESSPEEVKPAESTADAYVPEIRGDEQEIVGSIRQIKTSATKTGGTRYGVLVGERWYGTFDDKLGAKAQAAKDDGSEYVITWRPNGTYFDLVDVAAM